MNTIPQLWCIRAGVEFIHFCVVLPQLVMFMSVYLAWEFYRNAYQQAAGLLKILQGFAHARHAAPKFLPLDKNATTRVPVRWHWGVDVEATVIKVSHTRFPHHSVRADRGRAVQHKTDWITDPTPRAPTPKCCQTFLCSRSQRFVQENESWEWLRDRMSLEGGWSRNNRSYAASKAAASGSQQNLPLRLEAVEPLSRCGRLIFLMIHWRKTETALK